MICRRGWHRHRQADDYRSAGYYAIALLAASGRCDGVVDVRPFLAVCIRNAINKERRALGAKRHQLVQCVAGMPVGSALPSREIVPDRMAELREAHDLDNLSFAPAGQPRKGRYLKPAERETIRRIVDDNPGWGLRKIGREFLNLTGSPVAPNTIQEIRREYDRERSLARTASETRPTRQSAGSLKTA